MNAAVNIMLRSSGYCFAELPGGLDALYAVSQKRSPDDALPHKELYLGGDPAGFGPVSVTILPRTLSLIGGRS